VDFTSWSSVESKTRKVFIAMLVYQVYPQFEGCDPNHDVSYQYNCDYTPILEFFGKILIRVDQNDYSGDSHVLLDKDGKCGLLTFGWGSCSGCDALQSCDTLGKLNDLIESLQNDIKWFDSVENAVDYILDEEARKGEWRYHESLWEEFTGKVREFSVSR